MAHAPSSHSDRVAPAPLTAPELRWRCDPDLFRDGEDVAPSEAIAATIGQEAALDALRLGAELYGPGYNVFVTGVPGTGKSSLVGAILEEMRPACALPNDRVFVARFAEPERPRLLEFPRGTGAAFVEDLRRAVGVLHDGIRRLGSDDGYARRRAAIDAVAKDAERRGVGAFEAEAAAAGFSVPATPGGAGPFLLYGKGEEAFPVEALPAAVAAGRVPAADEARIRAEHARLTERLREMLSGLRTAAAERTRAIATVHREWASALVDAALDGVAQRFPGEGVAAYVAEARAHFVDAFPRHARAVLEGLEAEAGGVEGGDDDALREYTGNLLLDGASLPGCPLVIETTPTWANLFGQVDREALPTGAVRSDFRHLRAGSLLRADGGYLIVRASDVLADEDVWAQLKRVLAGQRLEISVPPAMLPSTPVVLHPDPIPVVVKVVMLGEEGTWHALRDADPEFADVFKVKVSFERDTELDDATLRRYAAFFRRYAREEGLPPFDADALAHLAEEAVREAGRRGRISVRFGRLADLAREAAYHARRAGSATVRGADVATALVEGARRAGTEERRARRAVRDGVLLLDTAGARVGTVNGLAVYDFGDHRFGQVARITAAVGAGRAGVVSLERLAAMSGATHAKGVLILAGFLRATFGGQRPLAFTGSLAFEQSYGGVDGDSATIAEVFAILSALARVPIRQDLAVTGSMNQHGDVQAVGGVNDKVEGFYDLCCERGLTGTQGVLIPRGNAGDLMLRRDVVAACEAGRFAVHAITRVEEGIELLTGLPAGRREEDGRFDRGSLFAIVDERLRALERLARPHARALAGDDAADPE